MVAEDGYFGREVLQPMLCNFTNGEVLELNLTYYTAATLNPAFFRFF